MNKLDLASRLAKQSHRSRAKAADAVDTLVHRFIERLEAALRRSRAAQSQGAP